MRITCYYQPPEDHFMILATRESPAVRILEDHVLISASRGSRASLTYQGIRCHSRLLGNRLLLWATDDHAGCSQLQKETMLRSVIRDQLKLSGTKGSHATVGYQGSCVALRYSMITCHAGYQEITCSATVCALYSTLLKVKKRGERTFSSRYGAGLRRFP